MFTPIAPRLCFCERRWGLISPNTSSPKQNFFRVYYKKYVQALIRPQKNSANIHIKKYVRYTPQKISPLYPHEKYSRLLFRPMNGTKIRA